MGKYGYQQRWGQKDSAKEGGSKTDNAHGAPTKKTERLRGADAKSGGSDGEGSEEGGAGRSGVVFFY